MQTGVVAAFHREEILRAIVHRIAIEVMDDKAARQLATMSLLPHEDVLVLGFVVREQHQPTVFAAQMGMRHRPGRPEFGVLTEATGGAGPVGLGVGG